MHGVQNNGRVRVSSGFILWAVKRNITVITAVRSSDQLMTMAMAMGGRAMMSSLSRVDHGSVQALHKLISELVLSNSEVRY